MTRRSREEVVVRARQITEDRAFLFLVRASQTSNVKLRDVAQNVVDMANDRFAPRD